MTLKAEDIIGVWRLESYKIVGRSGAAQYPLGRDPIGALIYTADGYMTVILSRRRRKHFTSDDLFLGTTDERAAAASSFIAYCGRYELQAEKVVHHVDMSLFPNRSGTSQVRFVSMTKERLTLSTPPLPLAGSLRTGRMVWGRARDKLSRR